ncbi:50S ribosomal protein L9 [Ahrensia marina]|uniref:Large ribosomal subunit protein bL9 n=1 Tax=Ahrensia marina TaxID=1514904 RepID=A0A0M9GP03_9HYPH|nr:50S ribosomal protein L9 [Ahrensia marina]KPB02397.1 50S ribosomal protein L9 [Ahrensia marina]
MKVILLERIAKLGAIGDEVTVKPGFARNYLLPSGRALRANAANREVFESQRAEIEARNEERKGVAQEISSGLDGKTFVVIRSAGETGQLYGSVTTRDISDFLVAEGHKVSRNQVDLKTPIKTIGLVEVLLTLHPEVETTITLNIARSADEAERQESGEDLSSADAIYGENEDKFESLADFEDEDDDRPRRDDNAEEASEEETASE